jgi:myosin heavy subunit
MCSSLLAAFLLASFCEDEEIVMPKGSDEKFVSKLNQIFDENAATKSLYFVRQRRSPMDFTVRHFAGDVTYNAKVCRSGFTCLPWWM